MTLPDAHETDGRSARVQERFRIAGRSSARARTCGRARDVTAPSDLRTTNEKINVYLFRDADRYRDYLMRNFPTVPSRRAFFLETDKRLCVYAHWSDRVAEDLRHEVAHGYLHAAIPECRCGWMKGLAEYFEVPRGQRGLNQPHVDLLTDMIEQENWKPNLKRLEKLTEAAQMDSSITPSRGRGCISC